LTRPLAPRRNPRPRSSPPTQAEDTVLNITVDAVRGLDDARPSGSGGGGGPGANGTPGGGANGSAPASNGGAPGSAAAAASAAFSSVSAAVNSAGAYGASSLSDAFSGAMAGANGAGAAAAAAAAGGGGAAGGPLPSRRGPPRVLVQATNVDTRLRRSTAAKPVQSGTAFLREGLRVPLTNKEAVVRLEARWALGAWGFGWCFEGERSILRRERRRLPRAACRRC